MQLYDHTVSQIKEWTDHSETLESTAVANEREVFAALLKRWALVVIMVEIGTALMFTFIDAQPACCCSAVTLANPNLLLTRNITTP